MDKSNPQMNVTNLDEINKQTRIKKLVDYLIDNAPEEALVDFSKQFLTKDLNADDEKLESSWNLYEDYISKKEGPIHEGRIIKFPE